jgi:shikimate kinase
MNVVITGFMCSGKTSVGKKLAEKLNFDFLDTDDLIENKVGMRITEIFEKYGEPYFRELEAQIIKEVSEKDKLVISTGGGVVLREENVNNLRKNGVIINLVAKPETIYERLKKQPGIRPLLNKPNPLEEIKKLLEYRERYYKNCDFRVETDNLSVEEIVEKILNFLKTKNFFYESKDRD